MQREEIKIAQLVNMVQRVKFFFYIPILEFKMLCQVQNAQILIKLDFFSFFKT